MRKRCTKCGKKRPENRFQVLSEKRLASWCKDCVNENHRRWKLRFPEKYKLAVERAKASRTLREPDWRATCRRRFVYGITKEQFLALRASQKDLCAICRGKMNPPCVDHDHKRNQMRALLCRTCNSAIGKLKDCPKLLRKAADYLEQFSATQKKQTTNTKQRKVEK